MKQVSSRQVRIENTRRGALYCALGPVIGVVLWVLLWRIGFIASIVSWLMAVLTVYFYKKGAGSLSRKSLRFILPAIVIGVVASMIAVFISDAFWAYGELATTDNYVNQGFFSVDFANFVLGNSTNTALLSEYFVDIMLSIVFAVLGVYGTVRELLQPEKAVADAEVELERKKQLKAQLKK